MGAANWLLAVQGCWFEIDANAFKNRIHWKEARKEPDLIYSKKFVWDAWMLIWGSRNWVIRWKKLKIWLMIPIRCVVPIVDNGPHQWYRQPWLESCLGRTYFRPFRSGWSQRSARLIHESGKPTFPTDTVCVWAGLLDDDAPEVASVVDEVTVFAVLCAATMVERRKTQQTVDRNTWIAMI